MKDKLTTECNRFIELCAEVRRHWAAHRGLVIDVDDYPSVIVRAQYFDLGCLEECTAMIFWFLREFPAVELQISHTKGRTVTSRCSPEFGIVGIPEFSSDVSEDESLDDVSIYQVLRVVNAILDHEVQHP